MLPLALDSQTGQNMFSMHWKNNTRDWPDAPADRISWRLIEGLELLQSEIEAAGDGYIDYVRLRRPPVGSQAKRSKSRYVAWDNLDDCRDASAQDIAAELSAAAEFVSRRDKCGEAFEVQISYLRGADRHPKSVSFNLADGPIDDGDADGKSDEGDEGDDMTSAKMAELLHKDPAMLLLMHMQQSHRDLLAFAESVRRTDSSRYDKLLAALMSSSREGKDIVERFTKMLSPVLDTAFNFTKMGAEAISANVEAERANKEAEMDVAFKRERLQTMEKALGGLTDLAKGVGVPLVAKALGLDPRAFTQDQKTDQTDQQTDKEMSEDERNQTIKSTALELRKSLTDAQLNAIERIDSKIATGLRSVSEASTTDDLKSIVTTIKDELQANILAMGQLSRELGQEQAGLVLVLLDLVFPQQAKT